MYWDPDTGLVTLMIQSVDTLTGELPEDPFAGFLPPNDDTGRGEGFVSFLVEPVPRLTDGTEILNAAELAVAAGTVAAFALDNGSQDAAVLVTLDPGAYTVKVSGVDGTTGVALVEIYEVAE